MNWIIQDVLHADDMYRTYFIKLDKSFELLLCMSLNVISLQ